MPTILLLRACGLIVEKNILQREKIRARKYLGEKISYAFMAYNPGKKSYTVTLYVAEKIYHPIWDYLLKIFHFNQCTDIFTSEILIQSVFYVSLDKLEQSC